LGVTPTAGRGKTATGLRCQHMFQGEALTAHVST
jgi:hypothetical protein